MTEPEQPAQTRPGIFQAGGELAGIPSRELRSIEGELVQAILPPYDDLNQNVLKRCINNWQHRDNIADIVRGKKYIGNLGAISLQQISTDEAIDRGGINVTQQNMIANSDNSNIFAMLIKTEAKGVVARGEIQRAAIYILRHRQASQIISTDSLWVRIVGHDTGDNTIEKTHDTRSGKAAGQYGRPR